MANNPEFYDDDVEAAVNAAAAKLNSGYLRIYSGSQPALDVSPAGTLLVQLTFGATAFGAATASGGMVTATANAIGSGVAANTGTASNFDLVKSDGTTVEATGTVGTSGCDLNLSSTTVTSGGNVSCGSFTITEPQT